MVGGRGDVSELAPYLPAPGLGARVSIDEAAERVIGARRRVAGDPVGMVGVLSRAGVQVHSGLGHPDVGGGPAGVLVVELSQRGDELAQVGGALSGRVGVIVDRPVGGHRRRVGARLPAASVSLGAMDDLVERLVVARIQRSLGAREAGVPGVQVVELLRGAQGQRRHRHHREPGRSPMQRVGVGLGEVPEHRGAPRVAPVARHVRFVPRLDIDRHPGRLPRCPQGLQRHLDAARVVAGLCAVAGVRHRGRAADSRPWG